MLFTSEFHLGVTLDSGRTSRPFGDHPARSSLIGLAVVQALREQIDRDSMFEDIVGSSGALNKVFRQVCKVAPSDSTILILGETGTGKELVARAIHKRSNRADRAFIGVNCAAIPPSLIASELFGQPSTGTSFQSPCPGEGSISGVFPCTFAAPEIFSTR